MATRSILPAFGSLPVSLERFAAAFDTDTATAQTVGHMAAIIRVSAGSAAVRRALGDALTGVRGASDERTRAAAIYAWVRSHVRFVPDELALADAGWPDERELLIKPERLLAMPQPQGDCDDFTMLVCAMLLAAGIHCEIVTIAADPGDTGRWSHVYAQALFADGTRATLDASHGTEFGWEAPMKFRRQVWKIFDGMGAVEGPGEGSGEGSVSGGGGIDWGSIIQGGANTGFSILKDVFGGPRPGQYTSTSGRAGTTVNYRLPPGGATASFLPPLTVGEGGGDLFTWLLIGGAVVAGFAILKR